MKKILLLVALLLPLAVLAQTPPPLRGPISARELEPFVYDLWNGTGDGAGAARRMLDDFDSRASVRGGLLKRDLQGQSVYWEQYSISSSLMARRPDSTEVQDNHFEGESRHTGHTYKTREWTDSKHFTESTDFGDEGFFCIYGCTVSDEAGHRTKTDTTEIVKLGAADLQIAYTPLKVHLKSAEVVMPVREGSSGTMEILLTDLRNRWGIDGYTLKVTSMNTDVFTVDNPEVTTGSDGKATVRLRGVKKGEGRIRLYLYLAQPENNSYVEVEEYYDVEVLGPERWEYSIHVHDAITEPSHDYTLTGTFAVVEVPFESKVRYHLAEVSQVSKSDGGTFETVGEFCDTLDRAGGVGLMFDPQGVAERATRKASELSGELGQFLGDLLQSMAAEQVVGEEVDSHYPLTMVLFFLEEGSWTFKFTMQDLERFGSDAEATSEADRQQAIRRKQMAYVREHHVLPIPDLQQHLAINLKNWYLTFEKNGEGGFGPLTGSFTLRRVEDE